MAANENGRVIFLDAPGTYNALRRANQAVYIDSIRLVSGAAAAAEAEVFAAPTAVATEKICHLTTATPGAAQKLSDEWNGPDSRSPVSLDGLTAVVTGAGAILFIYIC